MTKSKKQIISYLKNTYCRIGCSKIQGVGLFAIRDIPKNTVLFSGCPNQNWKKFNLEELGDLPSTVLKMIDDFFVIEKDGFVYIPESGLDALDMSFFVNHSKKPNLKIRYDKNDVLYFTTIKPIKKGQELTADYKTYDWKY